MLVSKFADYSASDTHCVRTAIVGAMHTRPPRDLPGSARLSIEINDGRTISVKFSDFGVVELDENNPQDDIWTINGDKYFGHQIRHWWVQEPTTRVCDGD